MESELTVMSINPSLEDLHKIREWLTEEELKSPGTVFFGNWHIIQKAFAEQKLFAFQFNGYNVGFVCWSDYDLYASIDIYAIAPNFRSMGMGRVFYNRLELHFQKLRFKAIKLFCEPASSERFWRQMGFIEFPDRGYSEHPLTYYKPLIFTNTKADFTGNNRLELWNKEPYECHNQAPNWSWSVRTGKAILHVCNPDWQIRLTIAGVKIFQGKVKYFANQEFYESPFLFIEHPNNQIFEKVWS